MIIFKMYELKSCR